MVDTSYNPKLIFNCEKGDEYYFKFLKEQQVRLTHFSQIHVHAKNKILTPKDHYCVPADQPSILSYVEKSQDTEPSQQKIKRIKCLNNEGEICMTLLNDFPQSDTDSLDSDCDSKTGCKKFCCSHLRNRHRTRKTNL